MVLRQTGAGRPEGLPLTSPGRAGTLRAQRWSQAGRRAAQCHLVPATCLQTPQWARLLEGPVAQRSKLQVHQQLPELRTAVLQVRRVHQGERPGGHPQTREPHYQALRLASRR